jgi:tRNA-splicing ligase RtcB
MTANTHPSTRPYEVFTEDGRPVKAWVNGVDLDPNARRQLLDIAGLPFIHKWVAAMPDVHVGKGATVGSVIATKRAIIPAAVGVDIGCGMMAIRTTLTASQLPDSLRNVRDAIEAAVPHGRTHDGRPGDKGAWTDVPQAPATAWQSLSARFDRIAAKHPAIRRANTAEHLGTLGTGNHFIEICLDEEQRVWVMLHSGSRGVGNRIGSYFIEAAKREMERWFITTPNRDLAYLPHGNLPLR